MIYVGAWNGSISGHSAWPTYRPAGGLHSPPGWPSWCSSRRWCTRGGPTSGREARRRADAAQRGDVHGASRQRLASRRTRGQELRSDRGVRHPIRVGTSSNRRQVRERVRGSLRRHRAAESPCRDPVSGAVAGIPDRVGFGAGPPRTRRNHRVPLRRRSHLLRQADDARDQSGPGASSGRRPYWTGRHCIPSSA